MPTSFFATSKTCGFFNMKIEAGKIVKAQGIKGEVKINCYLDDSAMLKDVKRLYVGSLTYNVQKIRCDGAFCYVMLEGVSDRNAAENLQNWIVYVDKSGVSIPSGRFFVTDLLDCIVVLNSGERVGKVVDVLQYGAADVFVCKDLNGQTISFPYLNDVVMSVNTETKIITADAKRFSEVVVYED